MSPINIGINGYGRIGRLVMRAAANNPKYNIVAVNDPFIPVKYMEYMYKYDTVHGRAQSEVSCDEDASTLTIGGNPVKVFGEMDPSNIAWGSVGADYVVESTGVFTSIDGASKHFKGGAKKSGHICPVGRRPYACMWGESGKV